MTNWRQWSFHAWLFLVFLLAALVWQSATCLIIALLFYIIGRLNNEEMPQ